ncbi:acireductone dioxygenase 1 [Paraphysoderma sedebokerense]|nr:acireductone dioxygenase 1 [Paraphysoderma sedebokerense]
MKAWYYNETAEDPRTPHHFQPDQPASLADLQSTGVLYWFVEVNGHEEKINQICAERNYKNRDVITVSPDKLPGYETKIKSFFDEHLHEDEEIRFILDGEGYFDVRDKQDRWIRIHMTKGDLIVLPAGIYHRFVTTTSNYIQAMRLFQEEPKWTPFSRSDPQTDSLGSRLTYKQEVLMESA